MPKKLTGYLIVDENLKPMELIQGGFAVFLSKDKANNWHIQGERVAEAEIFIGEALETEPLEFTRFVSSFTRGV